MMLELLRLVFVAAVFSKLVTLTSSQCSFADCGSCVSTTPSPDVDVDSESCVWCIPNSTVILILLGSDEVPTTSSGSMCMISNSTNYGCPSGYDAYDSFEMCPSTSTVASNGGGSGSKGKNKDGAPDEDGFIYSFFSKVHLPKWLQYVLDVVMLYPFILCFLGAFAAIDGKIGQISQILIGICIFPILPVVFVFGSLYQCLRCHHVCWGKSPSTSDDDDQFKAYCNCFGTFVAIGFCLYFASIYHNNLILYWIGFIILLIGICLLSCCITTGIPGAFFGLLFLFVCDWGCDGNTDREKCLGWLFSLLLLLFASGLIALIVVTDTYDLVSMWSLLILCALFIAWGIFFSVSFGSWLLLTWMKELFSKHVFDLTQFDNSANIGDTSDIIDEFDDFEADFSRAAAAKSISDSNDEAGTGRTNSKNHKNSKNLKDVEIATLSVGTANNRNDEVINIYNNNHDNTNTSSHDPLDSNQYSSTIDVSNANSDKLAPTQMERIRSLDDDDEI